MSIPDTSPVAPMAPPANPANTVNTVNTEEVILRARKLTKQFGSRTAVRALDLEVRRGDVFAGAEWIRQDHHITHGAGTDPANRRRD